MMNLPSDFEKRTSALLGEIDYQLFSDALQHDIPVSIRVNVEKYPHEVPGSTNVHWSRAGRYLASRPTFTFDPLFHAGCYYVQEASSMFVEQALRQYVHAPSVMLDLCAAPGGKSTLARSVLPEGSLLVANEVMRNRSQILAENLIKWGHPDVVVTSNDPADFSPLRHLFDVILTDVPCSGEGMFRKDATAIEEWSIENVDLCWQRQRRILTDIWDCLKLGGLLIYSTCTFNREENEDNVAWIANELGAEILPVDTLPEWNITGNLAGGDFPVYRFLPHRTVGEGLFLAVLRKHEGEIERMPEAKKKKDKKAKGGKGGNTVLTVPKELKQWINNPDDYNFAASGEKVTAISSRWSAVFDSLSSYLHILHAGITLAELKGKDFVPQHSLAMSTVKNDVFPSVELDYSQAISYLRKEAVVLDASAPRGYVLVKYAGVPLGFVKNIGNRANNLYPQEWRIRSGYLPDEVVTVFPAGDSE